MANLKRQAALAETVQPEQPLLKIGEVATRTGISIETLRFYERSGLLDRPVRTEGGYRLYDQEALATLDFIKRAQALGFTLDEIKRIIGESRAGQSPCHEVRETVRKRLAELDQRMALMQQYRDELAATLEQWDEAGEAAGHFCGLIESTPLPAAAPAKRGIERKRK